MLDRARHGTDYQVKNFIVALSVLISNGFLNFLICQTCVHLTVYVSNFSTVPFINQDVLFNRISTVQSMLLGFSKYIYIVEIINLKFFKSLKNIVK